MPKKPFNIKEFVFPFTELPNTDAWGMFQQEPDEGDEIFECAMPKVFADLKPAANLVASIIVPSKDVSIFLGHMSIWSACKGYMFRRKGKEVHLN